MCSCFINFFFTRWHFRVGCRRFQRTCAPSILIQFRFLYLKQKNLKLPLKLIFRNNIKPLQSIAGCHDSNVSILTVTTVIKKIEKFGEKNSYVTLKKRMDFTFSLGLQIFIRIKSSKWQQNSRKLLIGVLLFSLFFLEVGVHFCNDFKISGAFEMNFFVLYLIKGRCLVLLRMWETQWICNIDLFTQST